MFGISVHRKKFTKIHRIKCKKLSYLIMFLIIVSFCLFPIAKLFVINAEVANKNPSGYLQGIIDNVGEIQDSWFIQPDETFYNTVIQNYEGSYNSEATALQISTKEEFAAFAKTVNDDGKTFEGKYVKMMNDIDLQGSGITFTNNSSGDFTVTVNKVGTPSNLWRPIGNLTNAFCGTFCGQGYKITNMIVIHNFLAALFGANYGTIKELGITGSSNCYARVSNNGYAGGMVGYNTSSGKIINCYTTSNSYGYSESDFIRVGGIAGINRGEVKNSYATGNSFASSPNSYLSSGGLVGWNGSKIINCYSTGNCYSQSVSGASLAGGLVGDYDDSTTITNCYRRNDSIIRAKSDNSSSTISTAGTETALSNLKGIVTNTISGFNDDNVWYFTQGEYPRLVEIKNPNGYLQGINDNLGDIQESWYIQPNTDFYNTIMSNYDSSYESDSTALEIRTKEEFAAFAKTVNDGGKTFEGKYVKMMNDIDLQGSGITFTNSSSGNFTVTINKVGTPSNLWKPVGGESTQFKGTFDGREHSISNMISLSVESAKSYSGLFGRISTGATIKNLGITGNSSSYCSSTNSNSGGFVGWMDNGQIINCHSNCNTYAYNGTAKAWAGGLVGDCDGSIYNSYSTGNSYACGAGDGDVLVGGLFGENNGRAITVSKCFATGNVYGCSKNNATSNCGGIVGLASKSGTVISDCYALGNVYGYSIGSASCGGFCGRFEYCSIYNSYATGDVYGISTSNTWARSGGFAGCLRYNVLTKNCYASGSNIFSSGTSGGETSGGSGGFLGICFNDVTVTNCYRNTSAVISTTGHVTTNGTATDISTLKGMVTNTISGFNDDNAWYFANGEYPKLMWQLSANVNLGDTQVNSDGSTYYTFPSATVTSDTSDLKIYSIIVSAMDNEYPEELKSGVRIVSTGSGMTADTNNTDNSQYYTSESGLTLSGAQELIRGLKFYSDGPFNLKVQLSYSRLPSDVHYYPGTGHYYKFINEQKTWIDAYKAALSSNYRGMQGYLVTITSSGENDFCIGYSNNGTKTGAWTGGTSQLLNNMNTNAATLGDNVNYWYWACGPEARYSNGTYGNPSVSNGVFYDKKTRNGNSSGVQIKYNYNKWSDGQPNNHGEIECFTAINNSQLVGGWDDFSNNGDTSYFQGYMIEYGDRLYGNSETISCTAQDTKDVTVTISLDLGESQLGSDGDGYHTFPNATIESNSANLKIYSIIVSAMDKESPEELKSGARIVSTESGMAADSNNTDNSQYYTSASGISLSQAQIFIRGLKFYCNEDFNAKVQLSYVQMPSDVRYYPGTGHYYKVVNEAKTWIEAYNAALSSNFRGMQGYLANVTSEGENNFVRFLGDGKFWFGGTRKQLDNINTTFASLTDTNLGYFYWASGPELLYNPNTKTYDIPNSANSIFYNKTKSTDTTTNGEIVYSYSFFYDGEPNNYNDLDECCIALRSENLLPWSDFRSSNSFPYVIEWGDRLYGNSEAISCMVSATKDVTMNLTVDLSDNRVNDDGNTYYTFPSATVTSDTPGLEIYSIIVSAMDKEYPNELKSSARIVSTSDVMTADSNNTDNSQYYTSTNGISLSQAQTFIRGLKFYCNEDFNAKVQLSYVQLPSDVHYYPGTGHYYKVVNEAKTWIEAYNAALSSNFRGMQGYLANITSDAENTFVHSMTSNLYCWIGGTRFSVDSINTVSASYTNNSLGYWYWASGPELLYNPNMKSYGNPNPRNSVFYNKNKRSDTTTTGTIVYDYNNFDDIQPDNFSDDGYLHICQNDKWNDHWSTMALDCFSVEYGDRLYGNSETINCMSSATKRIMAKIDVSIITESGRHLSKISSDTVYDESCTINVDSNGVHTVKIMSGYYVGGTLTHVLESVGGNFIQNQKFTLVDYSNSTSQYYYYIVESDDLTQIPLTSFKKMEDKTTSWIEPMSSGVHSDKLQFIVDFSDTDQSVSKSTQNLKLSYKSNNIEIAAGIITINFGESSFYGNISKSGQDVVMEARGSDEKSAYAIAKITDSNGNQLSFSNKQLLSSNLGIFEIVRGGLAILKLGGLSNALTTYTMSNLSVMGLPNMSYKIQTSLCLSNEDNKCYPFVAKDIGMIIL